jgi:hypothetical protein
MPPKKRLRLEESPERGRTRAGTAFSGLRTGYFQTYNELRAAHPRTFSSSPALFLVGR